MARSAHDSAQNHTHSDVLSCRMPKDSLLSIRLRLPDICVLVLHLLA